MRLHYAVVFEQAPNNYCGYAPDVPGCISTGKTLEDMLAMMQEALTFHIEMMAQDGDPIPQPRMSIEDAMRDYLVPLTEAELKSYREFGEPEPPLSVTFQMVEIEVPAPVGAAVGEEAPAASPS